MYPAKNDSGLVPRVKKRFDNHWILLRRQYDMLQAWCLFGDICAHTSETCDICVQKKRIYKLVDFWWWCKQFSRFAHIEYLHLKTGDGWILLHSFIVQTFAHLVSYFPKIDILLGSVTLHCQTFFPKIWGCQYVANSVKCVTNFLPFQANVISGTIIYHLTLRFCSKSWQLIFLVVPYFRHLGVNPNFATYPSWSCEDKGPTQYLAYGSCFLEYLAILQLRLPAVLLKFKKAILKPFLNLEKKMSIRRMLPWPVVIIILTSPAPPCKICLVCMK